MLKRSLGKSGNSGGSPGDRTSDTSAWTRYSRRRRNGFFAFCEIQFTSEYTNLFRFALRCLSADGRQ